MKEFLIFIFKFTVWKNPKCFQPHLFNNIKDKEEKGNFNQ